MDFLSYDPLRRRRYVGGEGSNGVNTLAVKNLTIALEALVRVPKTKRLQKRIKDIIDDYLKEHEQQAEPSKQPDKDDEIPF